MDIPVSSFNPWFSLRISPVSQKKRPGGTEFGGEVYHNAAVTCLLKVFFYGFYHGKSQFNHHLGEYVSTFFQAS